MIDRYTKSVLTVIAVLLGVIVARDIPVVREALAAADFKNTVPVTIIEIDRCGDSAPGDCSWDAIQSVATNSM